MLSVLLAEKKRLANQRKTFLLEGSTRKAGGVGFGENFLLCLYLAKGL